MDSIQYQTWFFQNNLIIFQSKPIVDSLNTNEKTFFVSTKFAHLLSLLKAISALIGALTFDLEDLRFFLSFLSIYLAINQITTYIVKENPEKRIEFIDLASSFISEILILIGILFGFNDASQLFPKLLILVLLVVTLAVSYVNAKFGSLQIHTKFVYFENSTRIGLLLLGGAFAYFGLLSFIVSLEVILFVSSFVLVLQLVYANNRL